LLSGAFFGALGRPHLYDIILCSLLLVLIVAVAGVLPQARHNRRVRRTA
jgi:hypothetical protein